MGGKKKGVYMSGLLKPFGNPPANGVKYFATALLLESVKDPAWLAKVTNAIHSFWRNKNSQMLKEPTPGRPAKFRKLVPWVTWIATLLMPFMIGCRGLPKGERAYSTAFTGTSGTTLSTAAQPRVAAHPGQSGLHLLPDPRDAFAARLAMADNAERSLDVQYYIWKKDMVGKVLMERLYRAADRGVRVRLLIDDLGTMAPDRVLRTIDSHPNIEVRLFNPARLRAPRLLGVVLDLKRLNRRMHNKSFIADGQVAIVGGRNIGDEYFGAHADANFADLDVAVIGPVVKEASEAFDLYWNHAASVPIANLSRSKETPGQDAKSRTALATYLEGVKQSEYADAVRNSEFAQQLRQKAVKFQWGHASIIRDHPDKVLTPSDQEKTHITPVLRDLAQRTRQELFLVSPYFVPGKTGVKLLSDLTHRGVRVVVITSSLASTDGVPVHSIYKHSRKPLVEAGVELYELQPTPSARQKRRLGGSSGASLHAKTFAFDRQTLFVGSYNLDPRSRRLNTEMGMVIDSPELAATLPETVNPNLSHEAYRVQVENKHLVWVTHKDGKEVRYTSEPEAGWWKRVKSTVYGWLPIEGLL